jgi:cold-inducible RNA-binding protein
VVINIFIGNVDIKTTEEHLRNLFGAYGAVETVTIVKDRDTGEPRGFAFVEMTRSDEAQAAIVSLNGTSLNDRVLRVNEARPKPDREMPGYRGSRDHRRHQI